MPWLMKAEPDSRIVKGKDVKFSVDDFEALGISQWDGVRNHEAKNIMKDRMKVGDDVLFYHSNCKIPGIFALAEIVREGYPDYTAWDLDHPYYDPKTDKEKPTWYMVDVKFRSRLLHPPTLALIKHLASSTTLPSEVEYIGSEGFKAVKEMQLVNRGRLSVQPVTDKAYEVIKLLGERGGWEGLGQRSKGSKGRKGQREDVVQEEDRPAKKTKGGRSTRTLQSKTPDQVHTETNISDRARRKRKS
ncbi:hypothetical protein TREMEDRAFT_35209 [Tremella mesenterica DSM 1558]|uniref:uncharacterized protein n=1 Tax=Tremella mesenterica (strain ATCC 24925 / CBS 8224 / DSM 1558 / NBRC 9311 / NRRL Y-6157 / RJB 2259-6 / UBC 559-6) TaxID=578456 RepID=UPI00032B9D2B|nr:uncharacterized protein TREMEDRAFT_35209 [Tremella mesenterica DSM 1558]EIW66251.1 hypothetical protein TREMEDRAFT_35209 [Tremella mesenterica DSM 1558]